MSGVIIGVMEFLESIDQQGVALSAVIIIIGLVPAQDLVFLALATIYTFMLSRSLFTWPKNPGRLREIFLRAYVVLGTLLGLLLPLTYAIGGLSRGDDHTAKSAILHVFLLSCEILAENIISPLPIFLPQTRAIIPLLCTVRRIFVIANWNYEMWTNKTIPDVAPIKDVAWFWFGRGLSGANFVYSLVNLFGFLIPRFLSEPRPEWLEWPERETKQVKNERENSY